MEPLSSRELVRRAWKAAREELAVKFPDLPAEAPPQLEQVLVVVDYVVRHRIMEAFERVDWSRRASKEERIARVIAGLKKAGDNLR